MKTPILDKAEVSIDFPDKFYVGAFGRGSTFDVTADAEGIHLHLERAGEERRKIGFHVHYPLLAEILEAAAASIGDAKGISADDIVRLAAAAKELGKSARKRPSDT